MKVKNTQATADSPCWTKNRPNRQSVELLQSIFLIHSVFAVFVGPGAHKVTWSHQRAIGFSLEYAPTTRTHVNIHFTISKAEKTYRIGQNMSIHKSQTKIQSWASFIYFLWPHSSRRIVHARQHISPQHCTQRIPYYYKCSSSHQKPKEDKPRIARRLPQRRKYIPCLDEGPQLQT